MDNFESPHKRPRIEDTHDDFWDDDFTDDQLAHIDAVLSQVCPPQNAQSSNIIGNTPGSSTTIGTTSQSYIPETCSAYLSTKSASRVWTSLPIRPSLDVPGSISVHDLQPTQLSAQFAESELKKLKEVLAKTEHELQQKDKKCLLLSQQVDALQQENQVTNKQLQKLNTELNFMRQESFSRQCSLSQQNACGNSKFKKVPEKTLTKSFVDVTNVENDPKGFPTESSFSKGLNLQKAVDSLDKSSENRDFNEHSGKNKLIEHQIHYVETGSSLLAVLLGESLDTSSTKDVNVFSIFKKHEILIDCSDIEVGNTGLSRNEPLQRLDVNCFSNALDVRYGLLRLLENNGEDNFDDRMQSISSDMLFLKSRLGLKKDNAYCLLPVIENTLEFLPSLRCNVVSINGGHLSSLSPSNQGSALTSHSSYSGTTSSSGHSTADSYYESCIFKIICALRLLRTITYYSVKVRHCLLMESVMDFALNYAAMNMNENDKIFEHVSSPQPGPSSQMQDIENEDVNMSKDSKRCLILRKLISFCCQLPSVEDGVPPTLLLIIMDIFSALASYCPVNQLSRFLPLLSSLPIHRYTSLALQGSLVLQLAEFLQTLLLSPAIIEASCNQNDFCLWMLLVDSWIKARETSTSMIHKLDYQMIVLLSVCLNHQDVSPSFLISDECRCPFEVVSSLVLYLHSQRVVYNETGKIPSVYTLQKGISVLCQVSQRDSHFSDHRANVDAEFFAFLYWLPCIHNKLGLGDSAEAFMEIWNISSEDDA